MSNAAYTQPSLIKSDNEIKSSQRSQILSPVTDYESTGTGRCLTQILGYEATETQLIVKLMYGLNSHNCQFKDLRFFLNGKAYKLDGLSDKDFQVKNGGNFSWKHEFWKKEPETWIWFYVGNRLPDDVLKKTSMPFGILEYLCGDQSCLTNPRIDIEKSRTFLDLEARKWIDEAERPMREAEKLRAKEESEFNALLRSSSPRTMYLSAVRLEDASDRGKAKTVYREMIKRFPNAQEALLASQRLTRLSDVEAVESSNSNAAANARSAADSVRTQNYDQCVNDRNACYQRCGQLRGSAESRCKSGCSICSR